jgi:transcriptional regulator with XRE-family HTH domain
MQLIVTIYKTNSALYLYDNIGKMILNIFKQYRGACMNRKALGKRLREERVRSGLTQEQIAEHINVSTTYIGLVERGERSVTLEKLILLAKCYHVTIDCLLQESVPITSLQQDEELMTLWKLATDDEKNMILSIIKSVLSANNKK